MKLDHLGLTLDPQQLWMLPNMDAPTPAYLVHKACACIYQLERNRARLLHEMSPADCRPSACGCRDVNGFICRGVCVCVLDTTSTNFIKYAPHFGTWSPSSVVRPRHGPTAHIGSIGHSAPPHASNTAASAHWGRRYFVRVSFSARPLAPRRRASRSSGGDARRHARNNGMEYWNYALGFSERPLHVA